MALHPMIRWSIFGLRDHHQRSALDRVTAIVDDPANGLLSAPAHSPRSRNVLLASFAAPFQRPHPLRASPQHQETGARSFQETAHPTGIGESTWV